MKKLLLIILVTYLCGCHKEKVQPSPEGFEWGFLNWQYSAYVNINGVDILKYMRAAKDANNSWLGISMNSTDADTNYYYPLGISIPHTESGTYSLYNLGTSNNLSQISYMKTCCYSNPDAIGPTYSVNEADSLNNYIRIHVDTVTKELSGMFQATMYVDSFMQNGIDPDTVIMRCDTFYCKYSIQ